MTKSLIAFFTVVACCSSALVQMLSLTRHGARYPINTLFDGADLASYWGELTAVGMQQHYQLGGLFRRQYIEMEKIVEEHFNHTQIEAFTTYYNRTIDSMISFMQGLYPLGTGLKFYRQVDTSLLLPPYHYQDDIDESVFALPLGRSFLPHRENHDIFINCDPQIDVNLNTQHATIDEMNTRYEPLIRLVKEKLSISQPLNVVNMSSAFDTVLADQFLSRAQPIQEGDLQNMRHLHYFSNFLKMARNYSKSMNTPKLKWMFSAFDKRIQNSSMPLRWTMLGGHDTDIYPLLIDLNISSSVCIEELYRFGKTNALNCEPGPEFSSSLVFQLHSTNGGAFDVMLRYNGKHVYLCERKELRCDYKEFKQRVVKNYVDYATLCQKK